MLRRIVFLAALMLAMLTIAAAQEDYQPLFTLANEERIIARGNDRNAYDRKYTDPGAVTYHDGKFHMFRNGFQAWPATVQIGYLVSDDGINWTQPQEEPVLFTADFPYAEVAALASSVIVEDNGTWVLYVYTWNTLGGIGGKGAVARATADNPLGPWTVDEAPLLSAGEDGDWDGYSISAPQVVKTDTGYVMYYQGLDESRAQRIGIATSDDGITWTKYENNPVMEATEAWEAQAVQQPRVVQTDSGWLMVYRSQGEGRGNMRLGIATSDDGFTWMKYNSNPVFSAADVPGGQAFWYTALAHQEDTTYLYVEISPVSVVTDIYVLTMEGMLPTEN